MQFKTLSSEEEDVIVHKGTEAPGSGEYDRFSAEGMFACRRCGAFLYRSEDKFDAHCGWPSFDDAVLGAVERTDDADGTRTEITCRRCGGHLGHVFVGEKLTPRDTRHCVNSLSMRFVPKTGSGNGIENASFGGGCFWCTEAAFKMIRGVVSVTPGYAGGKTEHPSYEEVSLGTTGHAEVVRVGFDPTRISFEALLDVFFVSHDGATPNRQGNDEGTQYRSIILFEHDLHREIAQRFVAELEREGVSDRPIVTEIRPLDTFHEAEDYHHDYFAKHPEAAYCQAVIAPKLSKFSVKLGKYLRSAE
jgi:peptide methionine sulfoxide reductase msrA/msrB